MHDDDLRAAGDGVGHHLRKLRAFAIAAAVAVVFVDFYKVKPTGGRVGHDGALLRFDAFFALAGRRLAAIPESNRQGRRG